MDTARQSQAVAATNASAAAGAGGAPAPVPAGAAPRPPPPPPRETGHHPAAPDGAGHDEVVERGPVGPPRRPAGHARDDRPDDVRLVRPDSLAQGDRGGG